MSKAYLQISGVLGNSARPGWIELYKLVVNTDMASKQVAVNEKGWVRRIRVYGWSIQGEHDNDLQKAWRAGAKFASAVVEVVKIVNKMPVVKQRLRMKNVSVLDYQPSTDPGYVKPVAHFALEPATYNYEVGSALQLNPEPKEPLTVS